jgi:hypothetical protein
VEPEIAKLALIVRAIDQSLERSYCFHSCGIPTKWNSPAGRDALPGMTKDRRTRGFRHTFQASSWDDSARIWAHLRRLRTLQTYAKRRSADLGFPATITGLPSNRYAPTGRGSPYSASPHDQLSLLRRTDVVFGREGVAGASRVHRFSTAPRPAMMSISFRPSFALRSRIS